MNSDKNSLSKEIASPLYLGIKLQIHSSGKGQSPECKLKGNYLT